MHLSLVIFFTVIDTKPNPVYGISGPQESQDYCALDHTHTTSGDIDDIYV